jgi:hypothetical protein
VLRFVLLEAVLMREAAFVDMLNDVYGEVTICGMKYGAGYALREVDPIAFRCMKSDFEADMEDELLEETE